jgi:uncharacterized protein (DUF1786 family)
VLVESARHDPRGVGVNRPVNTAPLYYRVERLTDLQRGKVRTFLFLVAVSRADADDVVPIEAARIAVAASCGCGSTWAVATNGSLQLVADAALDFGNQRILVRSATDSQVLAVSVREARRLELLTHPTQIVVR